MLESEFETASMESEKKKPDSEENIKIFVHFTWEKLILNISLQDLQSWVT